MFDWRAAASAGGSTSGGCPRAASSSSASTGPLWSEHGRDGRRGPDRAPRAQGLLIGALLVARRNSHRRAQAGLMRAAERRYRTVADFT